VWIETPSTCACGNRKQSRTPLGVCGLKQDHQKQYQKSILSHPARGVWIETSYYFSLNTCLSRTPLGVCGLKRLQNWQRQGYLLSHPARGVWIETLLEEIRTYLSESHPARGVWIET